MVQDDHYSFLIFHGDRQGIGDRPKCSMGEVPGLFPFYLFPEEKYWCKTQVAQVQEPLTQRSERTGHVKGEESSPNAFLGKKAQQTLQEVFSFL